VALTKSTTAIVTALITAAITASATLIPAYWQHRTEIAQLQDQLAKARTKGRYEWQWAGAGWLGHVNVDNNGSASIEMSKFMNCLGGQKWLPLLEQRGKAEMTGDSNKVHVTIPVQFITYDDKCMNIGHESSNITMLEGDLTAKVSYAGRISYNTGQPHPGSGDMILVKDYESASYFAIEHK